jgi:hypothetical protein
MTICRTILSLLAITSVACAAESDDATSDAACPDGKCDALDDEETPLETPCGNVLVDRSGRGFLPARIANDAFIEQVYGDKKDGCPVEFSAIMKVLEKKDNKTCTGGIKGMQTHVISEQAQLSGTSDGAGYRAVTTRTCAGRPEFGLIFSMFGFSGGGSGGLDISGSAFPPGLEIIAFDEKNQVFNYYKEVGGKMGFFGSSTDFVTTKPGGPGVTDIRGCGNCHTGGGLIMKELTFPWVHWEGQFRVPGAEELVANRPQMGALALAERLEEEVVEPGNAAWNDRRVDFLSTEGTVKQMLAPLFCPVEVNLASMNRKDRIQNPFLLDSTLFRTLSLTSARVTTTASHYDRIIAAIGQQVPGTDAADLVAPMTFVARSGEDLDFVESLVEAGVIDESFQNDVLMIDFTRPVFSDDRCDLLEFAPELPAEERTADAIRDGFLANLADAEDGTPAAELRTHLQASKDGRSIDHAATASAFVAACTTRQANERIMVTGGQVSAFHADALKLRSLGRKIAFQDGAADNLDGSASHAIRVFEFDDTMPADDIAVTTSAKPTDLLKIHPAARLSPVDCTLVSEFVPTAVVEEPQETTAGAESCADRCGEFVNGASCQCDDRCSEFGNCCDDFEMVCG